MKPTFKIVSGSDIFCSSSNRSNKPLDWSKCLFCQKDTGKKLACPAEYSDRFKGAEYKTIGDALQAFNDLGYLPKDVNLTRMDDGDGLEQTFVSRRAKFPQHAVSNSTKMKFNVLLNRRCMQMMKFPLERKNNSPVKNYSEKKTPQLSVYSVTNQQLTQNLFTKPQHWTSTLEYVSVQLIYKISVYWLG